MACKCHPVAGWIGAALLLAVAVGAGWYLGSRTGGDSDATPAADQANTAPQTVFPDIAGRIVRIAPDDAVITIDHEAIEGFMAAMVMDFQVAETSELQGLEPGQNIIFDLVQLDGKYLIVRIRQASQAESAGARSAAEQPHPAPLQRGDLVPNLELFNAQGDRFHLRDIQAEHMLITFFYSRCPLDTFCPAQSRRLAELQNQIKASGKDLHLVSLTLDSGHDGPDVLAGYAERFHVDPQTWTLAGSEEGDAIRDFADRIGARIRQHEDSYQIDHALVAVRVDGDRIVDYAYGLDPMQRMVQGM